MAPPLPTPRAFIFDWDNTLVDTWPVIHQALGTTLVAMGHAPWSMEEVQRKVHRSMRDAFPALFGPRWEEAAAIYQQEFRTHHLDMLRPLPHALALLEWLQQAALPCVVVSNKKGENLRKELTHLGWDQYFAAVIGAEDTPHDKPHPFPAQEALAHCHLEPGENIWFIGDSIIDLHCAAATGCTAILYGLRAQEAPTGSAPELTAGILEDAAYHAASPCHDRLRGWIAAACASQAA